MKEKNKPEIEIVETQQQIETKQKRERKYYAFADDELQTLLESYRKLIRIDIKENQQSLLSNAQEIERELKIRSKLKLIK